MRNRRRLGVMSGLATFLVVLAIVLGFQKPAEAVLYSAGTFRAGTAICKCPTQVGDCVCEFSY